MALEPASPSASSVLLPFLTSRSRRGSMASMISTKGDMDKNVLAQALDNIHTSASKLDTLTSFHDYDGGASRDGTKELVSSGVSGLYDRVKRQWNGTPMKEPRDRPKSRGPKNSTDIPSAEISDITGSRTSLDNAKRKSSSPDTTSLFSNRSEALLPSSATLRSPGAPQDTHARALSPLQTAMQGESRTNKRTDGFNSQSRTVDPPGLTPSHLAAAEDESSSAPGTNRYDHSLPAATPHELPLLPTHDVQVDDPAIHKHVGGLMENGTTTAKDFKSPQATTYSSNPVGSDGVTRAMISETGETYHSGNGVQRSRLERPQLLSIGHSHLPGFEPSRASSTLDSADGESLSSKQSAAAKLQLEPSPNLNAGLQRKRTNMTPSESTTRALDAIPHHLKRRVVSKAFWMKDENAKDCFYCGQSFSTFRRKHHCRTCGQIFDAKCTVLVSGTPFGQPGTLRLCKSCESMVFGSDDSSVVSEEDETPKSPLRGGHSFTAEDLERPWTALTEESSRFPDASTPTIGIPVSRRNREAKRRSNILEFDAGPALARPSSSHSLISLARRPRSSSHKRYHSRQQAVRSMRLPPDDGVPFHPSSLDNNMRKLGHSHLHTDNFIDPDLAPFASDDGSEDESQSVFTSIGEVQNTLPADRETTGLGGFLTSATRKGRSRLGVTSSLRGNKDDDALSQASKPLPKLPRKRNTSFNLSFTNSTNDRPSPRRSRSNNLIKMPEVEPFDESKASPPPAQAANCSKIVRSSAMCEKGAPPVELNRVSLGHVRRLLAQLLADNCVESAAAWEKALLPILLLCSNDVEPNIQLGDDMDIRDYVKLKKVPGGRPGDTSYVSGVVFSKNIALKSMARSISQPRVAVVTFAIEYARHQARFMSLDPVIAQEQEYLRNLVGRIVALRPQVLLVQRNVSGLALGLLESAGITVVYNIKESVLAAVARVTQTTMIKSVDKLAIDPSHLGRCESFEVKTYVHGGRKKSYVYLSGCAPDLGCTIVLRGASTQVLQRIKRITEFMCYVAYNLKLETSLMRDEFVSIPSTVENRVEPYEVEESASRRRAAPNFSHGESIEPSESEPRRDGEIPSEYEDMVAQVRSRILSASPFVVFMQPYLLSQLRESERRLIAYKQLRDQYAAADEGANEDEKREEVEHFTIVSPEMVHVPASKDQPKTRREYLHAVHEAQFEKTMHTYETQRRLFESFMSASSDPFDPFSHQTIVLLQSTISKLNSAPCVGPELLYISFYAGVNHTEPEFEEDCTLGQFVEDSCLSANTSCRDCGNQMIDHHRQYVHGYGQVSISVQHQAAKLRGYHRTILMWASCRVCGQETTVAPMSENTWKYSFAKYLELCFWSAPLHPRAGVCQHDIHKDFLRFFGFEDLAVRIQYDPVDIYNVIVPRAIVTWKVESDLKMKNDQFFHFVARLDKFTDSVKKRLGSINVDTLDEKKAVEANELLDQLRKRADDDHHELLLKLQQKYVDSRYYEVVPLNRALRFMDEKALEWDKTFNDFERDYFPSENDIRKLATLQLRNMFLESQPPPSIAPSDASDTEDGTEVSNMFPKALRQHLRNNELYSEKAHDVLSSTVEEHRTSVVETEDLQAVVGDTAAEQPLGEVPENFSPRAHHEQAVERNDVKHLDLAIPTKSPDEGSPLQTSDSKQSSSSVSRPSSREDQSTSESFATQPKPLSTGLLERIEQIRNNHGSNGAEIDTSESKIPRLADLKRRDVSPRPIPPPLTRAQSHPNQVARKNDDADAGTVMDSIGNHGSTKEARITEKRLGERLGVARLASKMGKVAPSFIPRSIATRGEEGHQSTVSALAKHFEQMSREFEKERLKERRQRALRSRQARANPLASSRPVVEVYETATDAVGDKSFDQSKREWQSTGRQSPTVPEEQDPAPPPVTSSDDAQMEQTPAKSLCGQAPRDEQQAASDADGEGDLSDGDYSKSKARSRETSDPTSGTSSALLSPTGLPDGDLHSEISIPEHKKNVWFKYLAEFWSKRSASGWANLDYPLHANEHVFEDADIIVREDEPSSVVALSLSCDDYRAKVQQFRTHPKRQTQDVHNQGQSGTDPYEYDAQQGAIEDSLLSDTGTHMKYAFSHGPVKAFCKIFYAEAFDALRRKCGVADRFVESLSRCLKFDSKGGKTKSLFLKTLDNRFIIKSLQEVELKAFSKFAPDYFAFMSHTLFHGVPSVIAKMFGVFQVIVKNPTTGVDFSYYLLVMENLFYEQNPNRRFDLKGSMRNRKIESTGQPDEVLLDENLVETIFESPLFVREHARKLLQASVWNDTLWLCKQNVMDYSLMAGFDDERKEIVVGIIDCIRTYTWDKKLESWIKDRGKNKPTITSPKDYRNRFRVSMMQYVLQTPNCWHQFQAQMAMPKTLKEGLDRDDEGANTETDKD